MAEYDFASTAKRFPLLTGLNYFKNQIRIKRRYSQISHYIMNQFWKNIAWIILMLLTTALIFSLILQPEEKPEQLSISQVAERIIAGETMKLTVSGNTLEIELADGKKAISQKESEAGLSETLKNYGVTPEHLSLVALEIKDESGLKFWLTMMLPVLLPLLIIGVFIWIIFKQARTGVNQAFTFGKSNIRLSASFKDRITFKFYR